MVPDIFKRLLVITFIINAILVSTHEGEFWPFSIFPMFSQAGQPWSRGVVEQVQDEHRPDLWEIKPLEEIEQRVLPLENYGIHEIDFANFISKTTVWDQKRINGLRSTFSIEQYPDQKWMATRVKGFLTDDNEVTIRTYPMLLVTADTTYKNPNIFTDSTAVHE